MLDSVKIVRSGSNNELTVNSLSSTRATASTVDEILSVTNSMLKEKGLLGSDVSSWPTVLRYCTNRQCRVSPFYVLSVRW